MVAYVSCVLLEAHVTQIAVGSSIFGLASRR
jgi:hypothetical protein